MDVTLEDSSGRIARQGLLCKPDWKNSFPVALPSSRVTVRLISYDEVSNFLALHFRSIYGNQALTSPFLWIRPHANKSAFFNEVGDSFGFFDNDRLVGVFVGNIADWSSYYLRNCSILPTHHGRKIYQEFLDAFLELLSNEGFERALGEISPQNHKHQYILMKKGFSVTGLHLSERWGSLLLMTKHLTSAHAQVFQDQFCHWELARENQGRKEE